MDLPAGAFCPFRVEQTLGAGCTHLIEDSRTSHLNLPTSVCGGEGRLESPQHSASVKGPVFSLLFCSTALPGPPSFKSPLPEITPQGNSEQSQGMARSGALDPLRGYLPSGVTIA